MAANVLWTVRILARLVEGVGLRGRLESGVHDSPGRGWNLSERGTASSRQHPGERPRPAADVLPASEERPERPGASDSSCGTIYGPPVHRSSPSGRRTSRPARDCQEPRSLRVFVADGRTGTGQTRAGESVPADLTGLTGEEGASLSSRAGRDALQNRDRTAFPPTRRHRRYRGQRPHDIPLRLGGTDSPVAQRGRAMVEDRASKPPATRVLRPPSTDGAATAVNQ